MKFIGLLKQYSPKFGMHPELEKHLEAQRQAKQRKLKQQQIEELKARIGTQIEHCAYLGDELDRAGGWQGKHPNGMPKCEFDVNPLLRRIRAANDRLEELQQGLEELQAELTALDGAN
jgi:chromosome segregation ATPase